MKKLLILAFVCVLFLACCVKPEEVTKPTYVSKLQKATFHNDGGFGSWSQWSLEFENGKVIVILYNYQEFTIGAEYGVWVRKNGGFKVRKVK